MNNSAVYSHLGGGIGFPLNLNVQGGIAISSGDRNIRESIQIILGTKLGERVYRPDFGCRLSELTFADTFTLNFPVRLRGVATHYCSRKQRLHPAHHWTRRRYPAKL